MDLLMLRAVPVPIPVPSKSITRRPDIARVVILLDLVLLVFSVVVFYRF